MVRSDASYFSRFYRFSLYADLPPPHTHQYSLQSLFAIPSLTLIAANPEIITSPSVNKYSRQSLFSLFHEYSLRDLDLRSSMFSKSRDYY